MPFNENEHEHERRASIKLSILNLSGGLLKHTHTDTQLN